MTLRDELLGPAALGSRGLLDSQAIQSVCRAHDAGREDYTDLLLTLMNLETWFRLFVDGRTHEDVAAELSQRSLAA